jgi:hypothetical protein
MEIVFSIESISFIEITTTFGKVVDTFEVKQALNIAFEKCANIYLDRLLYNIETNKYGFKLTLATVRKKLAKGKSVKEANTPLLFEKDYLKNIVINKEIAFTTPKWVVTCTKGNHYSGLTYNELSYILEFGRKDLNIPARPVWRLTYKECLTTFQEVVKKDLTPFLVSSLKKQALEKFFKLK